ncbi:MAG: VIT1/CCC1 transporter family protein [Planctomycetes bacterium]|nr:VIT1/CCC1 transporter family protein [Planctomycetota bacterium]MBI3835934.1 VIT1/CCC1 transporter family protein [Planctomycetota bacterium]
MHDLNQPVSDASDHVREARERAREVLGGEAHLGPADDWRRALVSARDAIVLIWLTWIGLHALADPPFAGALLIALSVGGALVAGISAARSVQAQVQYYLSELERERHEIRTNFDHEIEEIRVLYGAKGFQEPLLTQVVDVLGADDDRLLKVMMEEELGLSMYHMNHPLLVGAWNFVGAAFGALILAVPVALRPADFAHWWMPSATITGLGAASILLARASRRSVLESCVAAYLMAAVSGGVVYFMAQWLRTIQRV